MGVARRGFYRVAESDLGLRHLDAIDLGGCTDHAPLGFALGGGYFELKVLDQGDQVSLGVHAELRRIRRASDAQDIGPRTGFAAFVHRLDVGREIDVFRDLDRIGRRSARGCVLDGDHQIVNRADLFALEQAGRDTGEQRVHMNIGGDAGFEGRGQGRGLRGIRPDLSGCAAPLEQTADKNAVRARTERKVFDQNVFDGHRVVAHQALGSQVGITLLGLLGDALECFLLGLDRNLLLELR